MGTRVDEKKIRVICQGSNLSVQVRETKGLTLAVELRRGRTEVVREKEGEG